MDAIIGQNLIIASCRYPTSYVFTTEKNQGQGHVLDLVSSLNVTINMVFKVIDDHDIYSYFCLTGFALNVWIHILSFDL